MNRPLIGYQKSLKEACELYLEMKYNKKHFRMTMFESDDFGKGKNRKNIFGCGAGRGRFSIDPYGDIHGCSKMSTIKCLGDGALPLGNVFQGFVQMPNRISLLNTTDQNRTKCKKCILRDHCGGGCPAINYFHTGSIYNPDELSCKMFFINDEIDEYMKRRYREVFGTEIDAEDKK